MTDLGALEKGFCPNEDCEGKIQHSLPQQIPLVACPRMERNNSFLQGQPVNEEAEKYLQELNCPLVSKLRGQ